ncbi:dimethylaniline monooxygenase (N-oxide forming) [Lophium mytilinum]|uniref:Dimethylaniline monooxygenase (N-oxide forming) n=1 Tax=Lophium mytilinum TaxID=390894 RepID=A0A6A6QGN2_9PEZI|nr:dimethylaniline monooxygenase (N-oxide forming) [Lophium mytilinum]
MEDYDLVIIGAGWFGLAAAKTYVQLHPTEKVIVVEAAATAGGVWGMDRIYPGLRANNILGTYEFSDYPMSHDYGVNPGEHISGAVLHRYLTNYAEHFGVFGLIRFNTKVETIEGSDSGRWKVHVAPADTTSKHPRYLSTKRLIVATGLASEPNIPDLPGREQFQNPVFHSRYFPDHSKTLSSARSVVVLGAAKSAWDCAYAYATSGVKVNMIVRRGGKGPVWMAPAHVTPFRKWLEKLVHTRFLTWFSPCIWGDEDGYSRIRGLLHGTFIGRKVVDAFWSVLSNDVIALNGFRKHPEVEKLKPWNSAFWIGSGLSILNYPTDFFALVRDGMIRVHIADVTDLSANTVHLSTGEELEADVLVCATGFTARPPLRFLPPGLDSGIDFSHHSMNSESLQLERRADAEILKRFPRLRAQPVLSQQDREEGVPLPLNLYRFIVPPNSLEHRNIAFAGMLTTITTAMCAQTQALWISAYFDTKLARLPASTRDARWVTMLHSRFVKWRYPCGYGARVPDFVFDAMPYVDMLLGDLGLNKHRKSSSTAEMFDPYGPEDYKDLVNEWKEKAAR